MKKPRCIINTDDNMSMNSQMTLTVHKPLNRIQIEHERQNGSKHYIQIFPHQIFEIVKFLTQAEKWIESGYKEKQKPESYIKERIF